MSLEKELYQRSHATCELSGETNHLVVYQIPKSPTSGIDAHILISKQCLEQIENPDTMIPNHWRCLNDIVCGVKFLQYK